MKKTMMLLLTALLTLTLSAAALAEPLSLDGVVTAAYTSEVYADSAAAALQVHVTPGQTVQAGDPVVTLRTTRVLAEADGTVAAVFAAPGDLAETVTARYGAPLWLEDSVTYTVAATNEKAWNSVAAKVVRVGESVYLRSRSNESRTGEGFITAVDGSSYTLHVTKGDFIVAETVEIFRTANLAEDACLGRGEVGRNAPIAVSAAGRIVHVAVAAGDTVKKGDLLLETLTGSGTSAVLKAEASGVVAEVAAVQGAALTEGQVAAVIWPREAMQIQASLPEADLGYIAVGDQVNLTFDWNSDSGQTLVGTVAGISAMADAASENTVFTLTVRFTPDENVRYGMNVIISTIEEEEAGA